MGFNFVIALRNVPKEGVICTFEAALSLLQKTEAEIVNTPDSETHKAT